MDKIKSLTSLARATVEKYVLEKEILEQSKIILPEFGNRKAGVFVTIYKNKKLRGCIGTIAPVQKNIIMEVIKNSVSSCSLDTRFTPIQKNELEELTYSVSVLNEPEAISSLEELDPSKYGVIVSTSDGRRGLLLPRLEGIKTANEQVNHSMMKGRIRHGEKIFLHRFEVIDYK